MRCIAVIEAQRPGLDTVLVWDRDGTLVAVAYLDGKITMTRPLAAGSLEDGVNEVLESFQINQGQFTRVTDWTQSAVQAEAIGPTRTRW